jgi:3-dehydroquinate synthase
MQCHFYFPEQEQEFGALEWQKLNPIILVDSRTNGFCLPVAKQLIPALKYAPVIIIPAGEDNKNLEIINYCWNQLIRLGANKTNILINLGGGVLSDIGGFVASTFMRGISFINIPTTLLAMNDASVGGKNGFNKQGIKNLIGTINLPKAVYINPIFLKTLSEKECMSGFAEIIKHALIDDETLWNTILTTKNIPEMYGSIEVLKQNIAIKNKFVEADLQDTGMRQALNFGHTIGHAIEAASYETKNPLLHGEAILLGMIAELWLSEQILLLDKSVRFQLIEWKQKLYPTLRIKITFADCEKYLQFDKKNAEGLNFCLLEKISKPKIKNIISEQLIKDCYQQIFG